MSTLDDLLAQEKWDIHAISDYFEALLEKAVGEVNAEFSPQQLGKATREEEPLPTDTRQLSSYRTRIGIMLEYAISTALARLLKKEYGDKYFLTFATSPEYPDFYLRDNAMTALLRIEMKAVDAESDEQAARFSTPTIWIDNNKDMLLLVGWKWEDLHDPNGSLVGEYPFIFASTILPAGEIAMERDRRLTITRGKIEGEEVYVYSRKESKYVRDPGNYGKFWRIVHSTRRRSGQLSDALRKFMDFLRKIDEQSPRSRLGSGGA